ncbi:hypothetical protein MW887_010728 [Aspergillus wentii]|nr:hypothetical protein MW887_010728 [Aspergillus wentii]
MDRVEVSGGVTGEFHNRLVAPKYWLQILAAGYVAHLLYSAVQRYFEYRRDTAFGLQHGCQLPPELPKRWPLGIDRIKELWDSNAEGRLLAFLCSVAKDYEPRNNLTQYLLFGPRAFHILHPKNVEAILSTNFKDYGFGVRPDIFAPLLGQGIFTQEGPAWKHSRDLLRKQFIRVQYQNLDHFREHVDNLIACLPSTGVVDLQPLFFNLTMDTATALLFGSSIYSLRAGIDQDMENQAFAENFNVAQEGLAKRFRIAPWHCFYNPSSFQKACSEVHRFVERYIDNLDLHDESSSEERYYGFIKQIAAESPTTKDLRNQLLNVLLAGRDTTACCLSWTFRLLVRHENVMSRLQQEVKSVMGDQAHPTREQIRKMPYLALVIKESLRLYPPVPLNNREAIRTTILPTGGGPDGESPIRTSTVLMRTNFRPERWEGEEGANIGWAFFPFNGGPRQCLGEDFALMEVSYTVVRLLQQFPHIRLPENEPNEPPGSEKQQLTLVLSSADGCKVELQSS